MAIEIFAQMDGNGDVGASKSNDYILVGRASDFTTLAHWVLDGYEAGRPKKPSMKALAVRIEKECQCSQYMRFKAKDCQLLITALEWGLVEGWQSHLQLRLFQNPVHPVSERTPSG